MMNSDEKSVEQIERIMMKFISLSDEKKELAREKAREFTEK